MSTLKEKKEEKPVKLEDVAEETGELIAKGVKKTWKVMKSFGEGFVDTIDSTHEKKEKSYCPKCNTRIIPQSNFCSKCGKKLV